MACTDRDDTDIVDDLRYWHGEAYDLVFDDVAELRRILLDDLEKLGPDHRYTMTTQYMLASRLGAAGQREASGGVSAGAARHTNTSSRIGPPRYCRHPQRPGMVAETKKQIAVGQPEPLDGLENWIAGSSRQ
jgi:hypothetical protein